MNYKTLLLTIFLFSIVAFPVLGANTFSYKIGGFTINDNTTPAQLIVYFFNIGIMIGGVLGVVMIIYAGFDYLTSNGNVGKIESAKKRIQNTVFGVFVLMGVYLILGTINPDLTIVKVNKVGCSDGLILKTIKGTKCIADSIESLPEDATGAIDKWSFRENTVYKVYAYTQKGYNGTPTEVTFGSGSLPANTKSVAIIGDKDGLYLFDDYNFKPGILSLPFFTNVSIENLGNYKIGNDTIDKTTCSIDVRNKNPKEVYGAILFTGINFSGKCSFISQVVPKLSQAVPGYYEPPIGDKQLSSLVVYATDSTRSTNLEEIGSVTFCNTINCGGIKGSCTGDDCPKEFNCIMPAYAGRVNKGSFFEGGCGWPKDERVLAMKISGNIGVVIRKNDQECAKWDVNSTELRSGNLIGQIEGSGGFPGGEGSKNYPEQFIIYPVDKQ